MKRALALAGLLFCALPAQALTLGQLDFTPCEIAQPSGLGIAQAQCAKFVVPENPRKPKARKLELAVTLLPARSANPKPDLVTMLAGGPGQSSVDAYFSVQPVLEQLRGERHLLLLDQRGTGNSNRLACPLPDWKTEQTPDAPTLQVLAEDCLDSLAGHADARWYTTTDAIRDLEALRQALGAPQLNLIGGSYGTRVGLEYLRRHPEGVRTALLDGVVPPELALLQDHARNLDEALEKLGRRCEADKDCRARYGNPLTTMRALVAQLRHAPQMVSYLHPRTHQPRSEKLTASLVQTFIRLFSYSPEAMSVLPLIVDEAAKGRPQALMAQIESLAGKLEDQLAHGMELSVTCAEDAPYLKTRAEDARTIMGGDLVELMQAQCGVWPRGSMPEDFKQPVKSGKPVLILSGEFDPVTPPRYGDQVIRTLSNARHLVAKGAGHIAMTRGCLPRLVKQFVAEANPKALDDACMETLGASPFFLGYEGPAP